MFRQNITQHISKVRSYVQKLIISESALNLDYVSQKHSHCSKKMFRNSSEKEKKHHTTAKETALVKIHKHKK